MRLRHTEAARRGALLSIWAIALGCAVEPVLGNSFLVEDGQPRAEIVISESPPRAVKLAAEELQAYIERISGAKLPITAQPGTEAAARVYVGRSPHTDARKITDEGLQHGAFRMVSGEGWLALVGHDSDFLPREPYARSVGDRDRMMKEWDALTGATWGNPVGARLCTKYNREIGIWTADRRGSLNAVYEFLRMLGVRWYMPGDLGEVVPKKTTIKLPEVDRVVRPDFPLRWCNFASFGISGSVAKAETLWSLRLGLNHGDEIIGHGEPGHGIRSVTSREETQRAHPEYYALWDGKRMTAENKPCLSSEGLFQENVRYVRAMFDIYDEPMVSVMPADGYMRRCECDLCKGQDTPERGLQGRISDYVWNYVNRVAQEVYKTHPQKRVSCFAYGAYLLPPEKIEKLSPNLVVGIAPTRGVPGRSSLPDAAARQRLAELRQGWTEKLASGQMLAWNHYLHSRPQREWEGVPAYYLRGIAEDLRCWNGVSLGDFIEVTLSKPDRPLSAGPVGTMYAPGFDHLNIYVTSRLYWDVAQDVDALIQEYCDLFFGPARDEMRAFIEYAEAHWRAMKEEPACATKALSMLATARQAAGDTTYGRRIDLLTEYCKPLK